MKVSRVFASRLHGQRPLPRRLCAAPRSARTRPASGTARERQQTGWSLGGSAVIERWSLLAGSTARKRARAVLPKASFKSTTRAVAGPRRQPRNSRETDKPAPPLGAPGRGQRPVRRVRDTKPHVYSHCKHGLGQLAHYPPSCTQVRQGAPARTKPAVKPVKKPNDPARGHGPQAICERPVRAALRAKCRSLSHLQMNR